MGRSLDELGETLSWRDLFVLLKHWQVTPGTRLLSAIKGMEVWTRSEQMLADVIDLTANANWQRQGKPNAPKPQRYKRPWEKPKETKLGAGAIPASQLNDWWDSQSKKNAA